MSGFFIFSGSLLIISGVLQVFVRPRKEKESMLERIVNRATVRAVVFVLAGTLGILLGTGVFPLPVPP